MTKERTLLIEDPALRSGFCALPRQVLHASNLSAGAKTLYALVLDFAWQTAQAWPGQDRLADELQAAKGTVRSWLQELYDARLLACRRRGQGLTNVYHVLGLAQAELPQHQAHSQDRPASPGQKSKIRASRKSNFDLLESQNLTPNKTQVNKTQVNTVIIKAVADRDSAEQAPDDAGRRAGGEDGEAADELRALVKDLAPRAVPGQKEAVAFIQTWGSLSAAIGAVKGAAERHRRTKQAEPILSWQYFLAAAERRKEPAPDAPRAAPCKACAGRGFLFDDRGDLAACAACRGGGIWVQVGRAGREPALHAPSPSG